MKSINEILNQVINGDVIETLKTLPNELTSLTITSPPYNKRSGMHGWLVNRDGYSHSDDHLPENEYQDWQVEVLNELWRITKPGGSLFYNHKIRWEKGKFLYPLQWLTRSDWMVRQEIVWDRGLAANMRGWRYWQVDERIYWLYKPVDGKIVGSELASKHAKLSSVWRIKPAPRSDLHPAPFPIEIPARIIYSMSGTEKTIILDSFCGAGTTLVAAHLLGHEFIGIDISPKYVEVARNRLENAENERKKIDEEIARHVIDDTFAERKKRGTVSWPYGPNMTTNRFIDDNGHINESTSETQEES
jgi:DNA modification methylase